MSAPIQSTTTRDFGCWTNYASNATLVDVVTVYLGEYADTYDLDGLCAAYREAINAVLPHGLTLCGDQFYGPAALFDTWGEGVAEEVREAIASVDLDALAKRFEYDLL